MTCEYCGSRIGDGEHRCQRCGRRPGDTLAPEIAVHRTDGALAAQVHTAPAIAPEAQPHAADLSRAVQRPLFHASNVIPIETYAPPRPEVRRKTPAKPQARRGPRAPEGQGTLDFLPSITAKPRTLGTTVDAVVCCEAPVATRLHRSLAAAADCSMVLIGYGLFLLVFSLSGGAFILDKSTVAIFGAMLGLTAFTYGLVFALAGTETAGMRWMRLRLITFDGFPPELKQRLLRFAGSCLSMCIVVGQLWSLADEETLTWGDHMSRTFPTPVESETIAFVRR